MHVVLARYFPAYSWVLSLWLAGVACRVSVCPANVCAAPAALSIDRPSVRAGAQL